MAAADCPDEQPSDPLKKFVDESPEFKELESIGTSTGRILYQPNTRMKDFSYFSRVFLHSRKRGTSESDVHINDNTRSL